MNKYIIENIVYLAQIDSRTGTVCISSCHPYDDQEYHWARRAKDTGDWVIYHKGWTLSTYPSVLTEEDIAEILHNRDRNLKPIMCYN